MSEVAKNEANVPEQPKYKLPDPELPDLEVPERPVVRGQKEEFSHVSCDGELYTPPKENPNIEPPAPGVPRILIGIPVLTISIEFFESFLKFWTSICLMEKGRMQVGYHFVYRKPVHMAEQALVEIAQYNKCTHILFMDDDIFDVTVEDLMKLIKADKDVIAGVMHASKFPYAMCVFRRFDTKKKVIDMPADNSMYRLYEVPCRCKKCETNMSHWDAKFCPNCGTENDNILQKADLVPFCFTLMKMHIFDKIKKPWFHCECGYPTDSWFGDKCIEVGIQEWGHMGVRLNHAGVTDASRPFKVQAGIEERKTAGKGLINISPVDMEKHEFMLRNKLVEAEHKMKSLTAPGWIVPGDVKSKEVKMNKEESNEQKNSSISDVVQEKKST